GQEHETSLEKFEILNVVSDVSKGDLTGSYIESDRRVAVFGGHQCANVPIDVCCCDHLEEQLIPVNSWGKFYVVGKSFDRGKAPDYIRVMASEDNTSVSVDPPVVSVPKLNAGKYFDFTTLNHCVITSDKPVLVGQYLAGQDAPEPGHSTCEDTLIFGMKCDGDPFGKSCNSDEDCSPGDANIGDPAFFIIPPVEQFRNDYIFLAPNKYAQDYITIVAPAGATVNFDDAPVSQSQFKIIGPGTYQAAYFLISDGVHTISSDKPVGVSVYGWDQYVSYGYAAGMNVETINLK
ncbi:MAG: IgGFc-binding protein, partial [Deltaproteobacteria bacterium]|nr:IgGFc-binding protein [Deltaproteobacteria bacterium]